MDVTRCPQCFKMTPMLLAVTPLPSPLTTPPDTSTYFMAGIPPGVPESQGVRSDDRRQPQSH